MELPQHLILEDAPAPGHDSPSYGLCRELVLDAVLLGRPGRIPASLADELGDWLRHTVLDGQREDLMGLAIEAVPPAMIPVLRWAGAPLGRVGPLHWGQDLAIDELRGPLIEDGRLLLPSPDRLAHMTSLALKPVRRFFAERLGIRLQAATGIGLWLWPDRALLVSRVAVPVAGFLHGPQPGRRCTLTLEPGGWQLVPLE